jgi:hypothetical protein
MSDLPIIETPDGEARKLGCLVPTSFPTGFPCYADEFRSEMLTLDKARQHLAPFNGRSMYDRRTRFAGAKYIRSQGSVGACNGFSTAGVLSRARELRGEPYVCLSGFDAYAQMNGGRDDGSMLADAMDAVLPTGIAPEEMNPNGYYYESQIPAAAKASRVRFKGFKAYAVDTEEELATALVLGRLLVIAVHADNGFMSVDGDGISRMGNGVGNHSVLLQDVGMLSDGTLWYDLGNSWDVTFCDGGYTKVTFNRQLRQTIQNHRFWALVSTTDDEQDSSVPPKVKG